MVAHNAVTELIGDEVAALRVDALKIIRADSERAYIA
jgi:hypothetical protein